VGSLLCLDPGETCGWSFWRDGELIETGQFKVESHLQLFEFIRSKEPDKVIAENYRVYDHRRDQHVGSEVVTIQYLGVIKMACQMYKIPLLLQMAYQAKAFQTDTKLKEWGLYQVAHKHANDSIRHACYYYLFHKHQ
jgi:hypothetical protein